MDEAYDYLVIGGGSAGCVLAGRLTEDPHVRVCLVEAGGPDRSALIHAPAGAALMVPTRINNWAYQTAPQAGLLGRRGYQPRGKTLGGSSAINAMLYVRGHRWDYDHWAGLGNPGWSYDEVLPYFRKAEHNETYQDVYHGQAGPLNVAELLQPSGLNAYFLAAAQQCGLTLNPDYNGAQQEGAFQYQVTQRDGERCSAAKAYLTPHLGRPNLTVLTNAVTQAVRFDGVRAVGVTVHVGGQSRALQARREVILSAGAFGSPQILMLSGIGDGQALQALGIRSQHHLPGVGANLQDHIDYIDAYRTRNDANTLGVSVRGGWRLLRGVMDWQRHRRGMLTSPFAESGAFLRSHPAVEVPDLQLIFVQAMVDDHARHLHLGHGFSCHVTVLRPKSRGTVTLATPSPFEAPCIDPQFFAHPDDLALLMTGARRQRQMLESSAMDAVRGARLYPVAVEDDHALEQDVRSRADTQYHPVGTCKMGDDALSVVDARLRVHGVTGLRVVDASIMPTLIGGNTNAPTIMVAEKAADMIRADAR